MKVTKVTQISALKCTESVWRRSPDLAGFKSGGRDKGRRKGETTGGDRQLREGTGMEEGAGGEKGRKRG